MFGFKAIIALVAAALGLSAVIAALAVLLNQPEEPECNGGKDLFQPSPEFNTAEDLPFILQKVNQFSQNPQQYIFQLPESPFTSWYTEDDQRVGLAKLAVMRGILDKFNLWNTYLGWFPPPPDGFQCPESAKTNRMPNGICNDLDTPLMGVAGTRFGNNIALFTEGENGQPLPNPALRQRTTEEIITPSPREISRKLLTRDGDGEDIPFLNLLGAAWIQFMIHDWFQTKPSIPHSDVENAFRVPLADDDPWKAFQDDLVVLRTPKDETRQPHEEPLLGPTVNNVLTHWWDGSQLYGNSKEESDRLRSFEGGKLKLDSEGYAQKAGDGFSDTGFRGNWWIGLEVVHNLFIKEHNAIAEHLAEQYPEMNDDALFSKARMINAALMARIHTLEWTPAVTPNPVLNMSMNANWDGLNQFLNPPLVADQLPPWFPEQFKPIVFGVKGGERDLKTDQQGNQVPFQMTQEFMAVYRMHPLLPDYLSIIRQSKHHGHFRNRRRAEPPRSLAKLRNRFARQTLDRVGLEDLLLTFGIRHSKTLTLRNYPKFLQELALDFVHPKSGLNEDSRDFSEEEQAQIEKVREEIPKFIDLGAVDILRDRERGMPRYNEFRKEMRLAPLQDISQLTEDPELLPALREIYNDDINQVDLMVGLLGEAERPTCFGFGETAFQVFISIATRRLQGDRFYTDSYNAETYTPEGIQWVETNSLKSVILRHYPELEESGISDLTNAFYPWE